VCSIRLGGTPRSPSVFGSYRPYFRYQYLNACGQRTFVPGYSPAGRPVAGVCRYDPTDFVALKFQYDYTSLRANPAINGLALQAGFTF